VCSIQRNATFNHLQVGPSSSIQYDDTVDFRLFRAFGEEGPKVGLRAWALSEVVYESKNEMPFHLARLVLTWLVLVTETRDSTRSHRSQR